jgi:hypothetical protein
MQGVHIYKETICFYGMPFSQFQNRYPIIKPTTKEKENLTKINYK